MKHVILLAFIDIISSEVIAQTLTKEQILDKYIPSIFFESKNTRFVPPEPVTKKIVARRSFACDFKNTDGVKYLIATYHLSPANVDIPQSQLSLIRIDKNGTTSLLPPMKNYDRLIFKEDSMFDCVDLDEDKIKEVIIKNLDSRGHPMDSHILKWRGDNLENITPLDSAGFSILENLVYEYSPGGPKPILYFEESRELGNEDKSVITFHRGLELGPVGFIDLGTFSFVKAITKDSPKVKEAGFSDIAVIPGAYTLEVKNLSKHPHSIRAEIFVNGSLFLKPSDFCEKPTKIVEKHSDQDSDDKNEDGFKRCVPKKDVYAQIVLKTTNSMRVKLYGNKHSRIQISLKSKD